MLALGKRMVLTTGAELFHLGDAADSIYLVARGRAPADAADAGAQPRGGRPGGRAIQRPDRRMVGADSALPLHPHRHGAARNRGDRAFPRKRSAVTSPRIPETGYAVSLNLVERHRPAPAALPGHVAARDAAHGGVALCVAGARLRSVAGVSGGLWRAAGGGLAPKVRPPAAGASERLEVPPPPFSEGIFPCTNCHAGMTPDRTRRELTAMHTDIVLKHDETHRWCLDCHDADNRDVLHLASGERVSVRGILPPVRPVPRREVPRLARRRPRPPHRQLERRQDATCCACTATIRTSRASRRWRPSPRRGRPPGA